MVIGCGIVVSARQLPDDPARQFGVGVTGAFEGWFDNKDGIPKAFLNQNQLGGALGGHIIKDKLFFYTNYEAFRNRQKSQVDNAILTATAWKSTVQTTKPSILISNRSDGRSPIRSVRRKCP